MNRNLLIVFACFALSMATPARARAEAPGSVFAPVAPVEVPALRQFEVRLDREPGAARHWNIVGVYAFDATMNGTAEIVVTTSDPERRRSAVGILSFTGERNRMYSSWWWSESFNFTPSAAPRAADITGDGIKELILADDRGRVHIFERARHGYDFMMRFDAAQSAVVLLEAADLARDGGAELVIASRDGMIVIADYRPWEGGFVLLQPEWVDGRPLGLALGDLDRNGWPEVAVSADLGEVAVFRPYVDGFLELWRGAPLPAPVRLAPAVADTDNDGFMELVAADNLGRYGVLEWHEFGIRHNRAGIPNIRTVEHVLTADMDGDGLEEIILAFKDGDLEVFGYDPAEDLYYLRAGFKGFGEGAAAIFAADLNNDGASELIAIRRQAGDRFSIFKFYSP